MKRGERGKEGERISGEGNREGGGERNKWEPEWSTCVREERERRRKERE